MSPAAPPRPRTDAMLVDPERVPAPVVDASYEPPWDGKHRGRWPLARGSRSDAGEPRSMRTRRRPPERAHASGQERLSSISRSSRVCPRSCLFVSAYETLLTSHDGPPASPDDRAGFHRTVEARGSIPLTSTRRPSSEALSDLLGRGLTCRWVQIVCRSVLRCRADGVEAWPARRDRGSPRHRAARTRHRLRNASRHQCGAAVAAGWRRCRRASSSSASTMVSSGSSGPPAITTTNRHQASVRFAA